MKKKRKKSGLKITVLILFIIALALGGVLAYSLLINKETTTTMYIASDKSDLIVLDEEGNQTSLIRGLEVSVSNKTKKIEDTEYTKLYYGENVYYVLNDNLVNDRNDSVLETELWVFRTCSVYKDDNSSKLNGLIEKGTKIEITGHSEVLADGSVERYGYEGGYIYAKYLTNDETYALNDNDSSYSLNMLADTDNPYGAGSASELDYYDNPKPIFENNVMPEACQALYINADAIRDIEDYIELAKQTNVNTFVIDIRDSHIITFKSEVMQEYSPSSYEAGIYTKEEFKKQLDKVKEAGIYMVARITVFKDRHFMEDHPEYAIIDLDGNEPFQYGGALWPSAYVREVWEYNVELSKEVVSDLGFNEVEYDYVRFPEQIDYYADTLGALDLQNKYNETRSQAIQRFLMYACDEVHKVGAYVSADVFGETSKDYVCAYGQYWPAISNVVDVISPMPYPDHFNQHSYDIEEIVWEVPYKLLLAWGKEALKQQTLIPTPAKVRTFLQGYNAIYEPYVIYDNSKLEEQIEGLIDSGIYDNGYIVWNSGSYIDNYYLYKDALSKY